MGEQKISFGGLAAKFLKATVTLEATIHEGLEHVGARIEATAKEEIGVYQDAVGPFPAWAPLAESTKDDRVAQGFPADEPLLRTGDLRDSISHEVQGHEVAIGSTSDIAVYQEQGTATIPPRPFLGPAAVRNEEVLLDTLGVAIVAGMRGTTRLPAYDMAIDAEVTK